jgi:flagellar hook-associated protein 1 FlgK
MGRISSIYTASSGLRAAQARMTTAANNVSNAGSEGYTRQRVGSTQSSMINLGGQVLIGTGVRTGSAERVRDIGADARTRDLAVRAGSDTVAATLTRQLEAVTSEPDNGITVAVTALWASFEDLAGAPNDVAVRRNVVSKLEDVAARINAVEEGMKALAGDVRVKIDQGVTEVRTLMDQLVEINGAIINGGRTPALEDARDLLSDKLSRSIGAVTDTQPDGTARVTLAGRGIVDRAGASPLLLDGSGTFPTLRGTAVPIGGEIGGLVAFITRTFPAAQTELQGTVLQLADALNSQHAAGLRPDGTAGGPLLGPVDGGGLFVSGSIVRVLVTDTDEIAAAGPGGGAFNGENAAALSSLRRTSGVDDRLRAFLTDVGSKVLTSARRATTSEALLATAEAARDSAHGVSLDEEMVSLMSEQKAFEASARVLTATDEMLDTLMRTGLVGR